MAYPSGRHLSSQPQDREAAGETRVNHLRTAAGKKKSEVNNNRMMHSPALNHGMTKRMFEQTSKYGPNLGPAIGQIIIPD